jgi:hypothetical protein
MLDFVPLRTIKESSSSAVSRRMSLWASTTAPKVQVLWWGAFSSSRARQESKGQRVTRDSKDLVELQEYRGVWESVGSRAR